MDVAVLLAMLGMDHNASAILQMEPLSLLLDSASTVTLSSGLFRLWLREAAALAFKDVPGIQPCNNASATIIKTFG